MTDTRPTCSFLIPTKALEDALAAVTPFVGAKSSIEVLRAVHIQATLAASYINFTTTDLDTRATATRQGTTFYDGELLVDLKTLKDAVAAVKPTDTITFTVNGGSTVEVKGRTSIRLALLPLHDFPEKPKPEPDVKSVVLGTADLLEALDWVAPAIAIDLTRPVLNSLNLRVDEGRVSIEACDSYRLHTQLLHNSEEFECTVPPGDYLLSGTFVKQLLKSKKHLGHQLFFTFGYEAGEERPTHCEVYAGAHDSLIMRTRLVEGQFPNVEQLIPQYEALDSIYACVERSDFESVVTGIKALARGKKHGAPARVRIARVYDDHGKADHLLSISFEQESAQLSDTMPVEVHDPQGVMDQLNPFDIGFNPEFLAEAFRCKERMCFAAITPLRPVRYNPDMDMDRFGLLMPIRLED